MSVHLNQPAAPLPVELVRFTALAQSPTAVRLAWTTASEHQIAAFTVERSRDGTSFLPLGQVAAAGTSAIPHNYAFTDASLPAGANPLYYRLRQVDWEGTASYSPVRPVALAGIAPALYPNPAHDSAMLLGAVAGTQVVVLDALGRPVLHTTADTTGTAHLVLPFGFASGVYVVRAGPQVLRLVLD